MGVTIDDYRKNVAAVLDAAIGSGARVVVLAQNEWFRVPSGQGYTTPEARDAFDAVLIEEAQSRGAEFVDMRDRSQARRPTDNLCGRGSASTPHPRPTRPGPPSSPPRVPAHLHLALRDVGRVCSSLSVENTPKCQRGKQARFRRSAGVPVTWAGCRRRRPSCHGTTVAAHDHRR